MKKKAKTKNIIIDKKTTLIAPADASDFDIEQAKILIFGAIDVIQKEKIKERNKKIC